ncbi:hypothetical protein FUAX_12480 [Fulvitalea axinellae]|uniref:VWFA domain-containing protein n=2 Tax=Fulvitalea axinellae TaxID=1182444 RepID=A0AAU9D7H2_9BACT|nr:hypothetical protein FUAX_12480 [Fulvitalea axinellae]
MNDIPWYSPTWFLPSTFESFDWAFPSVFYCLAIIPLLFGLRALINIKLDQKMPVALSRSELKSNPITLLRFVPPVFFTLSLVLAIIALARPQRTSEEVERWTEGIDIVLAIDISRSMQAMDFNPNRLEAAKKVATEFVKGRFQDRIGIVVFSGDAYRMAPLTTDYKFLESNIADINFNLIQNGGTAIGSALSVSLNLMRESETKSKVIVLLSDGDNNAGNIDPLTAVKLAEAYGIKVYTIAVGKEGPVKMGVGIYGDPIYNDNTMDEKTLRQIARIGKGKFFRATDNKTLENIFKRIDKYEKAEIKENRFSDTMDFYTVYLRWAILFFLIWIFFKSTFMNNILRD